MKIAVVLPNKGRKEIKLEKGQTGFNLFKKLNLEPDRVVLIKNKKPMPEDERLQEGDEISVIEVVSGG